MNPELPANEMSADRQQHDILLEAHSVGVSLPSLTSDPPAWVLDYDGRRDEVRCSLPPLANLLIAAGSLCTMTVVSALRQYCPALPRHSRERQSDESEVRITPWSSAARLSSAAISDLRYEFYPAASHPNYLRVSCNDSLYGRRELDTAR